MDKNNQCNQKIIGEIKIKSEFKSRKSIKKI